MRGENKATIMEDAGTIIVRFNASNRLYQIDVNGNLEGPKELIKDVDYVQKNLEIMSIYLMDIILLLWIMIRII